MADAGGSTAAANGAGAAATGTAAELFAGPGEMRARCRALDWSATALGPVEGWPSSLRTVVGLCLATPGPMCLSWGAVLVLIYNDGYRAVLGATKHPAALGRPTREVWAEVWDQLAPDFAAAMAGGLAVPHEDQRFVIRRDGRDEETFFSYAFVPVRDEAGRVGGGLHVLTETTGRVQAEAALRAERERLASLVLSMPAPVALHWGPDHRLAVVNAAFRQISGGRDFTGLTPAEAYPELAGQGILERFDEVVATGEAWVAPETPIRYDRRGLGPEDLWFDLRYEPVRDPDGRVAGVLNFSVDVTDQVRARREVEGLLAESEAARAALAASEARFRTVQDASPLGFAIHRPVYGPDGAVVDFTVPYVNDAGARVAGQPQARIVADTLRSVWPGTVESGLFAAYLRVLATGEPLHRELLYEHAELVTGLEITAVRIGEGADVELGITFTDITARLRAERERERLLADTEAARAAADLERRRLEAVLEQLPVGVHVAEAPGGRLVLDNPAVRAICGEAPRSAGVAAYSADYVGHYPAGHPRAGEPLASDAWPLARALATGTPVGEELVEIRRADGTRRLAGVSAAPVRDAEGRVVGAVATSVDLTEHERLHAEERAARERAERLQALAAALSAARTIADVARVITAEGRRVFEADGAGVALLEDAGRTFRYLALDGVPADIVAAWATFPSTPETPFGHVAATREPLVFGSLDEIGARFPAVREPSARQGIAAMIVLPLVGSDGRALGAAHLSFSAPHAPDAGDVASLLPSAVAVAQQCAETLERVRLFEAERAARAEAEAANRAKSEFLAVMSHELRTPLNAIGGYAELIELGIHGPVSEAQRAALARIQASQRHLLGLIAGVLDYARVEAGAATYRIVDVPVAEAVAEAETLVAPQLRAKGLGYTWSGAPPGLRVRADREKLQQILLNLLGNAVKFTDARGGVPGRVEVVCIVEEDGTAGGHVRIHVRDTGAGIAADALERIFEPFVQVDQRLTRPHAGVGLGLAISRDLARGMGGDLTAASTPGAGSTFTLTLASA